MTRLHIEEMSAGADDNFKAELRTKGHGSAEARAAREAGPSAQVTPWRQL